MELGVDRILVDEFEEHLSRISTLWTQVFRAHGDDLPLARAAQSEIVDRYSGAVYRYLGAVLGNRDAADEVFQEFALKFVQGGFRHANPDRGRFRDYLKVSILHLVSQYRRKQRGNVREEMDVELAAQDATASQEFDCHFRESCRNELLSRAWLSLKAIEDRSGRPLFTILDFRSKQPKLSSEMMASELTRRLAPDRPFTAASVRKSLQDARRKFAELLVHEVRHIIGGAGREELEQELVDLELHAYCQSALRDQRS